MFSRDRALSRIPVKKMKHLTQKAREVRVFVQKGIRKNTHLLFYIVILDAH